MRFDDRLGTLLAATPRDGEAKTALWGQLADVVTQAGDNGVAPALIRNAMERLLEWRHDVTPARRRVVSASLASPRAPAEIVALFASDTDEIAAPMLGRATLPDEGWQALIPRLSPASRNLLRQRRNLPFAAERTLRLFAQGDQTLPPGSAEIAEQAEPIQIRDLVARIEAYRKSHSPAPGEEDRENFNRFRFETNADGLIVWVEGAPRGALIGLNVAAAVSDGGAAVDDKLATALRLRTDCIDGQLSIDGAASVHGRWQVHARPFRGEGSSFGGLRGTATRIEPGPADNGLLAGTLAPDSVRQLAHELRTPLNAIRGFADLIAGQFLGPAPRVYRELAIAVVEDARALADVIADLDSAARLDMDAREIDGPGRCDPGSVVRRAANDLRPALDARALKLRVTAPVGLPEVAMADGDAEALVRRLMAIAVGLAGDDEAIEATLGIETDVILAITRPAVLAGLERDELFRSTLNADEALPGAPPLGLGFSLRLIDALARASRGAFELDGTAFVLRFPTPMQPLSHVA